jgi:hypothetical protein
MHRGFLKLYRKITDNKYYFSEPFTKTQAWIDLLIMANVKDNIIYIRGNKITVKRGQICRSQETLAERWKWSRGKVKRYLSDLKNEHQIIQQNNAVCSIISIVNYDDYNETDGRQYDRRTADSTTDGRQTVRQTDIEKNDNKDNNVKNENNENRQIEKIKNTWMRYQKFPNFTGLLSFKSHDDRMNKDIENQLKYAEVEEIEQAIKNFGQIAGNENYFGYKPCTIHEFMKRSDLQSFFDNANPLENKKIKEFKKPETESEKNAREVDEYLERCKIAEMKKVGENKDEYDDVPDPF